MTPEEYYARPLDGAPVEQWQDLRAHLEGVAELARAFTGRFGSGEWGWLAGLWHDIGKYQPAFQQRLRGEAVAAEHSGAGACLASGKDQNRGLFLAFAIAGHHTGLANLTRADACGPKPLTERLREQVSTLEAIRPRVPPDIMDAPLPDLPAGLMAGVSTPEEARRRLEFWTRFLFSALVDADRLNSERFAEPDKASTRSQYEGIPTLRQRLDAHVDALPTSCQPNVQAARIEVLQACRQAAPREPGVFTLTVPTGGGKTLSAMSFALRHAEHHGMRRVITVIPFTSIIEQNAGVYRQALGLENVLEHHSNLDPIESKQSGGAAIAAKLDLAAENWDAPVIVTTTVQFFESVFTSRPGRSRKIHNIANSVILLDEVQTLPVGFLHSILDALRELTAHYGCTVVLATATPPALEYREYMPEGLKDARSIIDDPSALARQLKRVTYHWPEPRPEPMNWDELVDAVLAHHQALAIVHKRQDARELAQALLDEGVDVIHLSALMCPAHRKEKLKVIEARLRDKECCIVVSTQLIEAGVDVDFPVVYRALGGLDSIVQAAGRCNREGRLESGEVFVFESPSKPPPGTPRHALQITRQLLAEFGDDLDPQDPDVCHRFFKRLYHGSERDQKRIQAERSDLNFHAVGCRFRLIEDGFTHTLAIPYGEGGERISALGQTIELGVGKRKAYRAVQPYTIQIYQDAFHSLEQHGAVTEVAPDVYTLTTPYHHLYDERFGLVAGDDIQAAPEALFG